MCTLITESKPVDIDLRPISDKSMRIPQYAIDIMAEYYLKKMREDYLKTKR